MHWQSYCSLKLKSVRGWALLESPTPHVHLLDKLWSNRNSNHVLPQNTLHWQGALQSRCVVPFFKLLTLVTYCRSRWPRGLSHELSSPSQTLESWVRIPLGSWMSVCVYSLFCCPVCAGSGLTTGWSPFKESCRLYKKIKKLKSGQGPRKDWR
jgi:hypothetical protein